MIGLHALVAALLGYGLLAVPATTLSLFDLGTLEPGAVRETTLRLACAMLGGLGITLLCLVPMTAPEVRRRIGIGLFVTSFPLVFATGGNVPVTIVAFVLAVAAAILANKTTGTGNRSLQQKWQDQIREAAAQQERNRLARDLHDSIKQQIFSVRVASATVEARWDNDPEGARDALAHVRRSAQEAAVEMQALLHQLRPEALANVGLVEALREQCEALGYRTGAQVVVGIGELPAEEQLPPTAQEALFRIAQEALANIARHARAATVHVRLGRTGEWEDQALELEVRDDGKGFDPAQETPGIGLRSMKERLQPFGGILKVESTAGSGARLIARMPLVPA
jgi:signal transduction histidine kinase